MRACVLASGQSERAKELDVPDAGDGEVGIGWRIDDGGFGEADPRLGGAYRVDGEHADPSGPGVADPEATVDRIPRPADAVLPGEAGACARRGGVALDRAGAPGQVLVLDTLEVGLGGVLEGDVELAVESVHRGGVNVAVALGVVDRRERRDAAQTQAELVGNEVAALVEHRVVVPVALELPAGVVLLRPHGEAIGADQAVRPDVADLAEGGLLSPASVAAADEKAP